MVRKQKALKAAQHCGIELSDHHGRSCFYKGVKWADKNPPQTWNKYPEEKPTKYDDYLVYTEYSDGDFMTEICKYDPKVNQLAQR